MDRNAALGYQLLSWLRPEMELNYGHDLLADGNNQETLAATVLAAVKLAF